MTTTEPTIDDVKAEHDRVFAECAHGMSILDRTGDTKLMWDPENEDEVKAAKNTFDELVKGKKMLAFKVKKSGKQGEQLKEFDPTAERMIITPALVGG